MVCVAIYAVLVASVAVASKRRNKEGGALP